MIEKPDFIRINGLVRVNGFVGWIIDIAESESSLMIKVDSAKCARRFQKPDWLDYSAAPEMGSPATLDVLQKDVEHERNAALKGIVAVDKYFARALNEINSQEPQKSLESA